VWKKFLGAGTIVTIVIIFVMASTDDEEAINLPNTVEEMKENVTNEVKKSVEETGVLLASDFNKIGKELSEDVESPEAKEMIESSMTQAGVWLALFLILSFYVALFGKKK
jgi:hypothetical protein